MNLFQIVPLFCLLISVLLIDGTSAEKSSKRFKGAGAENDDLDISDDLDSDYTDEDFDFDEAKDAKKQDLGKTMKDLYTAWNSIDLCRGVQCKPSEHCVIREKGIAACVSKKSKGNKKTKPEQTKGFSTDVKKDRLKHSEAKNINRFIDKSLDTAAKQKLEISCKSCPVVRPDFVCGSDNSTYSSICRLNFHNCVHTTIVDIKCKGFCPCKSSATTNTKQDKYSKWEQYLNAKKEKKTEKAKKAQKTGRKHGVVDNSVLKLSESEMVESSGSCSQEKLNIMGKRLLDWFSVVLNDEKRNHEKKHQKKLFKLPDCKKEIGWMFHRLDADGDLRLSLKELYDLEHDKYEKCLKQYLDNCDEDRDAFLNPYEWCTCFDRKSQPCTASLVHSKKGLLGAYVPQCDSTGFFAPTQCHSSSGVCWCVDKNGVEFTNTRRRGGKPDCEGMLNRARQKDSYDDDSDGEDDLDGSGDNQLSN